MPTGRHNLSSNAWRFQEIGALGWDITPWLTFSPSFEYNESVAEEGNAQPLNFLETFFPFTIILPHKWAVTAGYENKTDFENNNYITNRAKIAITKELKSIPVSFYLQAKRDFDSGEKEFQVNLPLLITSIETRRKTATFTIALADASGDKPGLVIAETPANCNGVSFAKRFFALDGHALPPSHSLG